MKSKLRKALVVDDEEALREIIIEVLGILNFNCLAAENGKKAIEIASKHAGDIDLVVIDLYMPKMSGKKAYDKISKYIPDSPVVFMSGFDLENAAAELDLNTRKKFIKKPFNITQFQDIILELI